MPPASRHLWVGNLPTSIEEGDLALLFSRFGEITRIAYIPGRSYAFIDLGSTDEAISALKSLNGFPVAGNPLRVEFTKDKLSTPSHNEDYHRDPLRSSERSLSSFQDSKFRNSGPDQYHPDKSRSGGRSSESDPSEVLWIGFPAQLKVDEMILRKAFSPFGEIEKITAFPGRTYAFIRFRDLTSACRAKETLQGKLFGNPRVHICFARSDSGGGGSYGGGKTSMAAPLSPILNSRSPPFVSNFKVEDPDIYRMNRSNVDPSLGYDHRRFSEERSEVGFPQYGFDDSPAREKGRNQPYPSRKGREFDPWDLPEETDLFPGGKRPRIGVVPPENELSEYDFSDLKRPRVISDFVQSEPLDRRVGRQMRYQEMPEETDRLRRHYDNVHVDSGPLRSISVERKRVTPELSRPSLKDWKWEGTIAKGGTPICRARCFPVGKALDMMLPEFLDCTARTSLEMLSKHYYQASGVWVVFFVPGSDADMGFYNEFMHYLEDKQRAAVAKLDDRTTMFLVPPSDFSQKVLKVAGNLSISGVILRLENAPASNAGRPLHQFDEVREQQQQHDLPELRRPVRDNLLYSATDVVGTSLNNPLIRQDLSSHNYVPRSGSSGQEMMSSAQFPSGSFDFPSSSSNASPLLKETRAPPGGVSTPTLNPELVAQLASSLLQGQQQSAQNARIGNQNQPDNAFRAPESYNFSNARTSSVQVQQFQPQQQQQSNFSTVAHHPPPAVVPRETQAANSGGAGGDNDPQKRLQATLQLAATLLQQIQQGKKT